uniref:RNase H type-1 domain-containing protein n=1 Tax=Quercus lobata TaxID=97700 RepID=A0A7N2N796_QUELO
MKKKSRLAAELWAVRNGIGLSISLNLRAVEIELDVKIIVDLLKDHNLANNSNATIGISLSISLNLHAVEIELDVKIIVDFLKDPNLANNSNAIIVIDCREIPRRFPQVRISHYYTKANKCTDPLA